MKRLFATLIILTISVTSCKTDKESENDVFSKVYPIDNIATQIFSIDAGIDNIIAGTNGTKIRIPKNSFVDSSGKPILGNIDFQLKEVLTREDMVLANLTTTFNGKPLETGGMIFIDALSNGNNLLLANDASILVALPADSILTGMSLFSGTQEVSGIKWSNPVSLGNPNSDTSRLSIESFEKTTNIMYQVDGFEDAKDSPDSIQNEVGRIAWEGDGLKITKDSTFTIGKYTVHFLKQDRLLKWSETFTVTKGTNNYNADKNSSYIFELKKLGWANIDRLLDDPRTKPVELITTVENQADFNLVYVTLLTKNMYLPGYQKRDNTFGFSHDDAEPQQLPVGEPATIIATAYKNNKAYFALKKITIEEKQTVSIKLLETTVEKLKADLKEKI